MHLNGKSRQHFESKNFVFTRASLNILHKIPGSPQAARLAFQVD
jgi:hypothetical protein